MKHITSAILKISIAIIILSCSPSSQTGSKPEVESLPDIDIYLNQIGFSPGAYKSAVVKGWAGDFAIVGDGSEEIVYQGKLGPVEYWEPAGEDVSIADFSELIKPGKYRLKIDNQFSTPFEVKTDIYDTIAVASLKAFYFHRLGIEIDSKYAGDYSRLAGHPDSVVMVHSSAATASRPEGSVISAPKGWYDAGDYNKYIVNSSITVCTMMSLFEHFPETVGGVDTNIPESGDATPDILDEIRWNLEWMLAMQDPEDGGIYHKLTSKAFGGMDLPHLDDSPRWVVMKTTSAALDFTAAMAQAARVYKAYDDAFATECLKAAERAWKWAADHPNIHYDQPEDIQTGAYGQSPKDLDDEFYWAATELAITTGTEYQVALPQNLIVPEWRNGAVVGLMNHIAHNPTTELKEAFFVLADSLAFNQLHSAWGVSNETFRWGSSGDFLNQAMVLLYAYHLSGTREYLNAAQATFDWVLGKNPLDYCFVTGFGSKPPMHIHHRPSEGDGILDPIPGWVAGGPNPQNKYDCGESAYLSDSPAKAYLDQLCSYGTNEVAINWNAPFVYVAFALSGL